MKPIRKGKTGSDWEKRFVKMWFKECYVSVAQPMMVKPGRKLVTNQDTLLNVFS